MTIEQIKESLSKDVVALIAHQSGFQVSSLEYDFGIDALLSKSDNYEHNNNMRFLEGGLILYLQLKSTAESNIWVGEHEIKYDLKAKNFNDLIHYQRKNYANLVLILVVFPDNEFPVKVMQQSIETFCKIYWYVPSKNEEMTTNKSTVRINIPKKNKIKANTFNELFNLLYEKRNG